MKKFVVASIFVVLGVGPDPASSQAIGIYSGFTENGEPVRLQVQPDPYNGGALSISMIDLSFAATCPKSGISSSASFFGGSIPIGFRRFASYTWFGTVNLALAGVFDRDDQISGSITGGIANYLQGTFKVENCSTRGVQYSATLESDGLLLENTRGPIRMVIREHNALPTESFR